jgi:hypothetical protein
MQFLVVLWFLVAYVLANLANHANHANPHPHTVSGISSGAFMAVQHHVAFSSLVTGVGVVAGGPYFCSQGKLPVALTSCTTTPSLISIPELVTITKATALSGYIDAPIHMKDDAVWLFSGTKDTVVDTGVVQKLHAYYTAFGVQNLVLVDSIAAEHSMPTLNYGSACAYKGEPYINNCNFDGAGEILKHVYNTSGAFRPPTTSIDTNIIEFSQSQFNPSVVNFTTIGMADIGYAYVPKACAADGERLISNTSLGPVSLSTSVLPPPCRLHIAYHGCLQSQAAIGSDYYLHAGYNRWAEANAIVVVYPQAKKNLFNPKGCWDWWGYSGPEFASNVGAQLFTVRNIVKRYFDGEENEKH